MYDNTIGVREGWLEVGIPRMGLWPERDFNIEGTRLKPLLGLLWVQGLG